MPATPLAHCDSTQPLAAALSKQIQTVEGAAASAGAPLALYSSAAARCLETHALALHPPHALMHSAGLAVARLALALAPHAQHIWVAAGPGNNGGDGLIAARWLHAWGKTVEVSLLADASRLPPDATDALHAAQAAGLHIHPHTSPHQNPDVVVDALLGLGQRRAPEGELAAAVRAIAQAHLPRGHQPGATVLAVDVPTGLCADSGYPLGEVCVQADATLALLSLKPGLFTGEGRDWAGALWWAPLLAPEHPAWRAVPANAWLLNAQDALALLPPRRHAQHKGSFGDVWVIGGSAGMTGAAHLAARAALCAGAGRVFVAAPDATGAPSPADDPLYPELMHRSASAWQAPGVLEQATVVCGCGGGTAVASVLPAVLARAARLVLDADALNAVAADAALQTALRARAERGLATVLTPHPLEAARLAGCSTAHIQAQRCQAAQQLAQQTQSVLVLKGAGSVVAAPGGGLWLNPTGNASLATPGSGDVLAGWLGGLWSAQGRGGGVQAEAELARRCAGAAVWLHGQAATDAAGGAAGGLRLPLPAHELVELMRRVVLGFGYC